MVRAIERTETAFNGLAVSLTCIITLVVCADVFWRVVFNAPIRWAIDLSESLMLGIVFLSLSYTQAKKEHVGVGVLWDRMSPRVQVWLNLVAWLLSLAVFAIVTWQAADIAYGSALIREHKFGLVAFPIWPAKILIPLGSGLLCARLVVDVSRELRRLLRLTHDTGVGGKSLGS